MVVSCHWVLGTKPRFCTKVSPLNPSGISLALWMIPFKTFITIISMLFLTVLTFFFRLVLSLVCGPGYHQTFSNPLVSALAPCRVQGTRAKGTWFAFSSGKWTQCLLPTRSTVTMMNTKPYQFFHIKTILLYVIHNQIHHDIQWSLPITPDKPPGTSQRQPV